MKKNIYLLAALAFCLVNPLTPLKSCASDPNKDSQNIPIGYQLRCLGSRDSFDLFFQGWLRQDDQTNDTYIPKDLFEIVWEYYGNLFTDPKLCSQHSAEDFDDMAPYKEGWIIVHQRLGAQRLYDEYKKEVFLFNAVTGEKITLDAFNDLMSIDRISCLDSAPKNDLIACFIGKKKVATVKIDFKSKTSTLLQTLDLPLLPEGNIFNYYSPLLLLHPDLNFLAVGWSRSNPGKAGILMWRQDDKEAGKFVEQSDELLSVTSRYEDQYSKELNAWFYNNTMTVKNIVLDTHSNRIFFIQEEQLKERLGLGKLNSQLKERLGLGKLNSQIRYVKVDTKESFQCSLSNKICQIIPGTTQPIFTSLAISENNNYLFVSFINNMQTSGAENKEVDNYFVMRFDLIENPEQEKLPLDNATIFASGEGTVKQLCAAPDGKSVAVVSEKEVALYSLKKLNKDNQVIKRVVQTFKDEEIKVFDTRIHPVSFSGGMVLLIASSSFSAKYILRCWA